jgi:hypothetical protein
MPVAGPGKHIVKLLPNKFQTAIRPLFAPGNEPVVVTVTLPQSHRVRMGVMRALSAKPELRPSCAPSAIPCN